MAIYYFVVGLPIIVYLFLKQRHLRFKKCNNEEFVIVFFFLMYLAILCLRDLSVGIDVKTYISRFFEPYRGYSFAKIRSISSEWGFGYLTKIISSVSSNPHVYLSIIAILTVLPIMILYKEEATEGVLCISIFMITLLFDINFSGLRQGLAIAMGVPAFYFSKEKKILPYLLIVLLSFSFHQSGLVLLLLYPIYHAHITKKWLWVVAPLMILIFVYNAQVFGFIFEKMGGYYFEKYGVEAAGYKQTAQYGQLILFFIFSTYSYFMLDEKLGDESEEDIGLRNLLLLATALQCFAPLHVIASRMNFYYILFIPVTVSRVSTHSKPRYKKMAKVASVGMTVFFILYFFARKGDSLQIFNYEFCF